MTIAPTTATARQYELNASIAPTLERDAMISVRARNTRKFSGRQSPKFTPNKIAEKLAGTLAQFPAKTIAQATGGSVRSAENARQALHAMSLTHFFNAAQDLPEVRALALELLGVEGITDPEFHRGIHHLINAYVRMEGAP